MNDERILKTIYEATYDAWLAVLGTNNCAYPMTTREIHETIGKAVEKATEAYWDSKEDSE